MSKEKELSKKIMGEIAGIESYGFVLILDENRELNISTNIGGSSDDHSLIVTILEGIIKSYKKDLNKTIEHFDARDFKTKPES